MSEVRQVKQQMTASESGVHWLAGKTVEIVECDQGEPWDEPIVKVRCEGKSVWMNPKDFPLPAHSAMNGERSERPVRD